MFQHTYPSEVTTVLKTYGTTYPGRKLMSLQFSRPIRCVTYRYAPDLHPVTVANHEAERRVSSTAVHLHKLWIAGSVCANRKCDSMFFSNLRFLLSWTPKQVYIRLPYILIYSCDIGCVYYHTTFMWFIYYSALVWSIHPFASQKASLNSFTSHCSFWFCLFICLTFCIFFLVWEVCVTAPDHNLII